MRLTIERIRIENFKGTRQADIDFGQSETRIFGMNSTGKSTIPDAFCWVLWNKDSKGNAPGSDNFREKPLDSDGKEIHNIDTSVELICRLDGQPYNLRRTQRENWVKKRGNVEAVYQGNVSTYWINDVETKLSDFKARIAQIASEEVFRIVGSLSAFNQIQWKDRRQQLLDIAGTDVDAELLSRQEYRTIADEIAQRNIAVDDLRKVLIDKRKLIGDELRMIPVRIDEARKAIPVITLQEISDAEYIIKTSLDDIERISGYIENERIESGSTSIRQRMLAIETDLLSAKRCVMSTYNDERQELVKASDRATELFKTESARISKLRERIIADKNRLKDSIKRRDDWRSDYTRNFEETFDKQGESTCPTCGQMLPDEAIEQARTVFNESRKRILAKIKQAGVEESDKIKNLEESISEAESELKELESSVQESQQDRSDAQNRLRNFPSVPDYDTDPRISEMQAQIDSLKKELEASPDEKIKGYEIRKADINKIIDRNRTVLARRETGKETEKRIGELEGQQKDLGARVTELENQIALVERFVQDRCSALEESINERFHSVRWKLFDVQINGGITEVCTCMIPCASGLVSYESANTAAQVNADLEIVNVLSRHYDVSLPLFVDNSERVNVLNHTDAQLITLSVSTDSGLRIEKMDKEAI